MNIRTTKQILSLIGPFFVLLLLLGQILQWHSPWAGWLLFGGYLFFVGGWWQEIWRRLFGMRQREWGTRLLAYGTVSILLSLVSGLFVAWYKLSDVWLWSVFFFTAIVTYGLLLFARKKKSWHKKAVKLSGGSSCAILRQHWGLLVAYAALWAAALYVLLQSNSTVALFSPWQSVSDYYLPLFFILSVLLGIILFSRYSIKIILFFVIAHTLLLHLYLPLSHSLPWGGDVWRHIGIERQLIAGEQVHPVLFGDNVETTDIGPLVIPKVLITPQKYIYTQLWGVSVLLSQTLHVDVIAINIWLVPILWSLFLPLLLFRIGAMLFRSWRYGLLFSAVLNIAFPFQALGGLSLPVSLGYITFFLVLTWWIQYLRTNNPLQRNCALGFGVLMLFAYPLHAVLFWFSVLLSFFFRIIERESFLKKISSHREPLRKAALLFVAVFSILLFPIIEITIKISSVAGSWNIRDVAKQVVGQLSGWFYASGIRPHDIISGNIFFNHTPEYAFVENIFTQWRWFFIPVMIGLFGFAIFGICRSIQEKQYMMSSIMPLLLLSTFGGYLIGWFVLLGDRLFVRRLDAFLIFLIILFAMQGIRYLPSPGGLWRRVGIFVGILVYAWIGTATYASGPDMRVVSQAEFDAASYIWQEEDHALSSHCVVGDTWMLLALEGISGRKIVGGNFPIDSQFGQNDRIHVYGEMIVDPSIDTLDTAHELTSALRCWVVLPKDHVSGNVREKIDALTKSDVQDVGNLYLWREALKPEPLPDGEGEA